MLSQWERIWLMQMAQAFDDSWDRKWLRQETRGAKEVPLYGRPPSREHKQPVIRSEKVPILPTNARRKGPEHLIYQRAMMRAAQIVCRAIKSRQLKRPEELMCVDCKTERAAQYEHRDYAKPLDVDPVCRACNRKRGPAIISQTVPSQPQKARRKAGQEAA